MDRIAVSFLPAAERFRQPGIEEIHSAGEGSEIIDRSGLFVKRHIRFILNVPRLAGNLKD